MAAEYGCYTPDDISLAVAPIYHGAGMAFALAPVYFGGTVSLLKSFNAEDVLRSLDTDGITNVFLVPTMFQAIFALPETGRRRYAHSALKVIMSNAAPLPQATKELIVREWPLSGLYELYGSTEGGIVTTLRPRDQLRKNQCVGQPFPLTDIKLLNDEGDEVEVGEVGELFSRSPYLLNGYHKQPEALLESLRGQYFSAGDMAVLDDEGYFYIVDRKKDMIVTGGVNVYPREVEEVLLRHPKIADVAVIGVADTYWGEAVKAVIVLKPTMKASIEEIIHFCDGKLARFKHPNTIEFVAALPRNSAGKVLKRRLREVIRENDPK
jgi:long-chain acyl-CoA synthetase